MKKGLIITGTVLLLGAGAVRGADEWHLNQDPSSPQDESKYYRANEFSLDVFGTLSLDEGNVSHISLDRVRDYSRWGAGLGGNFFLNRNIGIGGEAYSENTDQHFVDRAGGHLILRVPIGETGLAPYGFAGGGHLFDPRSGSSAHAGGGLEFRFTPNFGIILDCRYVWTDAIGNFAVARAGLRIAF